MLNAGRLFFNVFAERFLYMAKQVRRGGFRRGFLGFGKKPKPSTEAEKPAVPNAAAQSEALRFALKQLSFQSKYFPELIANL